MGGTTAQIPHPGFTDSESTKQIKTFSSQRTHLQDEPLLGTSDNILPAQQTMTSKPCTPNTECHLKIINVISGMEAMGPLPHF